MHGFSLKIKTKTPEDLTQHWYFYSGLVVDGPANYNIITKEEKDPKAYPSVSVIANFNSHSSKQNHPFL